MSLALRNLLQDRVRFALSVAGVALAVMLILILRAFLTGMNRQITSYLDHAPGSLVLSQQGVGNLLGATSVLPRGAWESVEAEAGVERAIPILSQFVILELHEKKQPVYLVGYLPESGGGPWQIAEGRPPEADDEVVFDRVLARRHDIALGDRLTILGEELAVVGFSEGTTSWMTSFVFVRISAAESLLRAPGLRSFLLVTIEEGFAPAPIRARLAELPGIDALTVEEVRANDLRLFARIFSAPLRLMVAIAFLIGVMIVGMVIYTSTAERQREYGVLKAVGARNRVLYQVVGAQAVLASAAGAALGIVLARVAGGLIMAVRPQFLLSLETSDVLRAAGLGVAMALIAALVPARLIARLEPGAVFRR
jgi:putative ABC transport system permease protein